MRPTAICLAISVAISFAGPVVVAANAQVARPPSLVGLWRYDAKQSETLAGQDIPAELTMNVVADSPTMFQWIIRITMADGGQGAVGFDGAINGKPYPVQGGAPGSTSAFTWMPDGSLKRVDESKGGIVTEICSFTRDAKRMECAARQTDINGRVATYFEVFVRQ